MNTGNDYAVLDMSTGVDLARIALTPVPRFRPAISPTGWQAAVADSARVAIADAATGAVLHEVPTSSLALVAEV